MNIKRILSFLLALVLAVSLLPMPGVFAEEGENGEPEEEISEEEETPEEDDVSEEIIPPEENSDYSGIEYPDWYFMSLSETPIPVDLTLKTNPTVTKRIFPGYYTAPESGFDTDVVDVQIDGSNFSAYNMGDSSEVSNLDGLRYVFSKEENGNLMAQCRGIYLAPYGISAYIPNHSRANYLTITQIDSTEYGPRFSIYGIDSESRNNRYLLFGNTSNNLLFNRATVYQYSGYEGTFYFYKKDAEAVNSMIPGYSSISTAEDLVEIKDGVLVAVKVGEQVYILNANTTSGSGCVVSMHPGHTDVTFTAKSEGNTKITVGNMEFDVTVSSLPKMALADAVSGEASIGNTTTVYVPVGGTSSEFTVFGTSGWTGDSVAVLKDIETMTQCDSLLQIGNSYAGDIVPASQFLYTIEPSGSGYTAYGITEGGETVWLNPDSNVTVNSSTPGVFTMTCGDRDGSFHVSGSSHPLMLNKYLNNYWGDQEYSKEVVFYRPVSGQGSAELPGYERVTETNELSGQLLIGVYYNGDIYFLRPSSNFNIYNRIDHLGKTKHTYLTESRRVAFTGVKPGVTEVTVGGRRFKIVVYDTPLSNMGTAKGSTVKKLVITAGTDYQLLIPSDMRSNSNDTAVGVCVNGNTATVSGISQGSATLQFGNETVVVEVVPDGDGQIVDFYIAEITHSTAYFCVANKTTQSYGELYELMQGEVIYLKIDGNCVINYFAKSDDHFALTKMGATGSAGNYKKIMGTNAEDTEYFKDKAPNNDFAAGIGSINAAMAIGCTGAMGFTTGAINPSSLMFRSVPLAEVEAKPAKVNSTPYQDGTPVKEKDEVSFEISITVAADTGVKYQNATVKNQLGSKSQDTGIDVTNLLNYLKDHQTSLGENGTLGLVLDVSTGDVSEFNGESSSLGDTKTLVTITRKGNLLTYQMTTPSYSVDKNDVEAFTAGIALENKVELSYSYTSTFGGSPETIENFSNAVAVLTIDIRGKLGYMNLTLGQTININVFFQDKETAEWLRENKGYQVVIAQGNTVVAKKDFTDGQAWTLQNPDGSATGINCHRFSFPVAFTDMAKEFSVYVTDENGNRVSGVQNSLSVAKYARSLQTEAGKSKLITSWRLAGSDAGKAVGDYTKLYKLLTAMLNYGTYLQVYRGDTSGFPTDAADPDMLTTQTDYLKTLQTEPYFKLVETDSRILFYGMSLELSGIKFIAKVYFDAPEHEHEFGVKISYNEPDPESGNLYQFTKPTGADYAQGKYYVVIPDIDLTKLNTTYRVSVTLTGEGEEPKESFVEFSAMYYAYMLSQMAEYTDNTTLQNLMHAFFDYCTAAKAYFG